MRQQKEWEKPEFKKILPVDFVTGVASKIKFMAHPDKIRTLFHQQGIEDL